MEKGIVILCKCVSIVFAKGLLTTKNVQQRPTSTIIILSRHGEQELRFDQMILMEKQKLGSAVQRFWCTVFFSPDWF